MADTVKSTSDMRTVNNSTRQTFRVLTEAEKAQVDVIKQRGAEFIEYLHTIGQTDPEGERMASRNLSLAMTHMEDAVMRAVRHITA
tara:strand:- start:1193 stop:1450 length:258 start_codon:yes stop_codon:yes gene_type:complete